MRAAADLHCHVLPGIDDGARDIDDAVAMAWQGQRDGIGAICATPHIRHDHDVRIAELPERRQELIAALKADGCEIEILAGGEVAATALAGLDDCELTAVSLGGAGRWVLLEPARGPLDDDFERVVQELCDRGFRAVVAHPERHLAPDLTSRLARLVARGALVQATAAYFTEEETAAGMLQLARAGLVHVLGSDAHTSLAGRPVSLSGALEVLRAIDPGGERLDWIARIAPEAIVRGEELTPTF